jgi:hypothetical protein
MHITFPCPRLQELPTRSRCRLTRLPLVAFTAAFIVEACHNPTGPLAVHGAPSESFSIVVGQEIDITMYTVGPGQYVSPPELTGSAIDFLDMSYPAGQNPGGPTQLYRFKGVASGQTIILFHNTIGQRDVSDTVAVR